MFVYVPWVWCSQKPEEDNRFPGNGVTYGYELTCVLGI